MVSPDAPEVSSVYFGLRSQSEGGPVFVGRRAHFVRLRHAVGDSAGLDGRVVGLEAVVWRTATAAGLDQRVVEIVGVCDLYGVIGVVVRTDPDEVGSRWQRVGCAGFGR